MVGFEKYLQPGAKGYLIGIGGVSMSPLAEVLCGIGLKIAGSDINDGDAVRNLRQIGMNVNIGHDSENITDDIDFIVRTAAVRDNNPEIVRAGELGIPVFERTDAWGAIMKNYKNAVCISGTHGKTTTTSMVTHILMAENLDPTVMIGGTLPLLQAGHRVGRGDTIVLEACEYYDSFLSFYPTVAVVLNVEADHLDYFSDLEAVKVSFQKFASLVPPEGHIVANIDDENTMRALEPLGRRLLTFGRSEMADVRAVNISMHGASSEFDIHIHGEFFVRIKLNVPGMHNVMNALASAAAAACLGVSAAAMREGLEMFGGARRRFEFKGKLNGSDVFDDYAHHPGELKALFDAVGVLGYNRVITVFQPHTYTRTKALMQDFSEQLKRADICLLAEIFAAREQNTAGVSSKDLADLIPGAKYFESLDELSREVERLAAPGDVILTVGAGDIYKIGEKLVSV